MAGLALVVQMAVILAQGGSTQAVGPPHGEDDSSCLLQLSVEDAGRNASRGAEVSGTASPADDVGLMEKLVEKEFSVMENSLADIVEMKKMELGAAGKERGAAPGDGRSPQKYDTNANQMAIELEKTDAGSTNDRHLEVADTAVAATANATAAFVIEMCSGARTGQRFTMTLPPNPTVAPKGTFSTDARWSASLCYTGGDPQVAWLNADWRSDASLGVIINSAEWVNAACAQRGSGMSLAVNQCNGEFASWVRNKWWRDNTGCAWCRGVPDLMTALGGTGWDVLHTVMDDESYKFVEVPTAPGEATTTTTTTTVAAAADATAALAWRYMTDFYQAEWASDGVIRHTGSAQCWMGGAVSEEEFDGVRFTPVADANGWYQVYVGLREASRGNTTDNHAWSFPGGLHVWGGQCGITQVQLRTGHAGHGDPDMPQYGTGSCDSPFAPNNTEIEIRLSADKQSFEYLVGGGIFHTAAASVAENLVIDVQSCYGGVYNVQGVGGLADSPATQPAPTCVRMAFGAPAQVCEESGYARVTSVEQCNVCAERFQCDAQSLHPCPGGYSTCATEVAPGWCTGSKYGSEYAHHFQTNCAQMGPQIRYNPMCEDGRDGMGSGNCQGPGSIAASNTAPICLVVAQQATSTTTTLPAAADPAGPDADPADQSSVVGDPHVVNAAKVKFEIRAEGVHTLVQMPQFIHSNARPDLRVDAEIRHLMSHDCDKSFVTSLSVFGRWAEDAFGLLRISPGSDVPNTTLLVNTQAPEEFFKQFPRPEVKAGRESLSFKLRDVGFHVGKHFEGRYGEQRAYLNVRIAGLKKYKDLGGLLGYDDHKAAEKPSADCMAAQPPAASRSSLVGSGRSVPSTDGGSRIEAE